MNSCTSCGPWIVVKACSWFATWKMGANHFCLLVAAKLMLSTSIKNFLLLYSYCFFSLHVLFFVVIVFAFRCMAVWFVASTGSWPLTGAQRVWQWLKMTSPNRPANSGHLLLVQPSSFEQVHHDHQATHVWWYEVYIKIIKSGKQFWYRSTSSTNMGSTCCWFESLSFSGVVLILLVGHEWPTVSW